MYFQTFAKKSESEDVSQLWGKGAPESGGKYKRMPFLVSGSLLHSYGGTETE